MSVSIRQSHANNDQPLWVSASAPPPTPSSAFQSVFAYQDYLPFPYLTIAEAGVGWTPLATATITPNTNGAISLIASARVISELNNPQVSVYGTFRVNGTIVGDTIPNAITSIDANDNYILDSEWTFPAIAGTPYTVEFIASCDYDSGNPGFTCIVARMVLLSN